MAIIVIVQSQWASFEQMLADQLTTLKTPFIVVNNKFDIQKETSCLPVKIPYPVMNVSALTGWGVENLVKQIGQLQQQFSTKRPLLEGIIQESDTLLLITPIDSEAPEGRLILPQVQTIRAILDHNAIAVVMKEEKVASYLKNYPLPRMVIVDSQVFDKIAPLIPREIPLTSFSILLASQKVHFQAYLQGTPKIEHLQAGDHVLILEACTHQTSHEDIGRVKIPNALQKYIGKPLNFTFISGLQKLPDLSSFALIVQCGGCIHTHKQIENRLKEAVDKNIPLTNYGMLLAYVNGIYERAIEVVKGVGGVPYIPTPMH